MAVNTKNLVVYCIQFVEETDSIEEQKLAAQQYLNKKNQERMSSTSPYGSMSQVRWVMQNRFVDRITKKSRKFPSLERALMECKRTNAELIITKVKELIKNQYFTQLLLSYKVPFRCLEQLTLTLDTLPAILDTLEAMSRRQSEVIRKALRSARGPLGNPNALKEITKVNKPKRENAIMFALMLAPIIANYRQDGLSQRKMVEALNKEKLPAPEGGQWVLSQLQKVLERIEINSIALSTSEAIEEFKIKDYTKEQQVKALNAMGMHAPGKNGWNISNLERVVERADLIADIINFNQFIIDVYPEINENIDNGKPVEDIAANLNGKKIKIPARIRWEIEQQQISIESEALENWNTSTINLTNQIVGRRAQDIAHYLNTNTLKQSREIVDLELEKILN